MIKNKKKNEHIRTGKTESTVNNPELNNIDDDIFIPFSRNIKDLKDEKVETISERNTDTKDKKIIIKDKNIEITTRKGTDDISTNYSLSFKDNKDTKADAVISTSVKDSISKVNTNVMHKTDATNEKQSDNTHSRPKIDENSRRNMKLVSHYYEREIHIPVAVIYDTDIDMIKIKKNQDFVTSSTTEQTLTFTPSRIMVGKQRKQQKGFILRASSVSEDKVETTTPRKPQPQEKHEEVQSEMKAQSKEQISVVPEMDQIFVTTQNAQTSDTSQKVEFTTRTSKESAKSTTETAVQTEKKKRVRDPVVPIVESESNIFSQTGEFRYR